MPSLFSPTRPRWLRRIAAVNAGILAWSLGLSLPAQALAHQPPPAPPLGIRHLSPADMAKIVGSQKGGETNGTPGGGTPPTIHDPAVNPASGGSYPWQSSVGGTNTGNGNKTTQLPIIGWTARGGLPVSLTLAHNSKSSHNSELGQKWTHSFDLFLNVDTSGNASVHWGDDQDIAFTKNVTGSFSAPAGIHDSLVLNSNGSYTLTLPNQVKYHFVAGTGTTTTFYCDTITDPNGNALTLGYNTSNFLTSVSDPTSRTLTLSYTSGRISSVTDPLSRTWSFSYDTSGNLSSVSLPVLSSTTYSYTFGYDTNHNVTSLTSPGSRTATFSYNSTDNSLAWEQDPAGNRTTYAYTTAATTVTDPNSHATVYTYTSGRLTQVTDALSYHEDYVYDTDNNKTQVTDKRGYAWQYTFDSMGNVLTSKDPYLNTTTTTYNSQNKPLTVTDPLSHVTTYAYDSTGVNCTSVTDALSHATTLSYNANGTLASVTDPLSHTTSYGYDTNGNVTNITDALSHAKTSVCDTLGRTTSVTDALSLTTTTSYDAWGRVSSVTSPAGTTSKTYDADSNVLTLTDMNSHVTTLTYDADCRPLTVTKANGDVVTFRYDGNLPASGFVTGQKGLLSAKTDGNNHTTTYTYTVRNQKASVLYPDSTGESWTYNSIGVLASHTDGKSQTTTYTLDNASKLTGITYPTGTANVSFGYDNAGRRTSMTDGTGTTGYTFDNANRLTQIAAPGGTTGYGYDNANRRTSMTVSGVTGSWTYGYDAGNRLTTVTNPYSETTTNTYDVGNRVTQTTAGNSSVTLYGYDGASRTNDVWHKTSGGTTLGRYQYVYNNGGLVTSRSDNDGSTTTFGYDNADQITSETRSGTGAYTVGYTYDHNGNRLTKTLNSVTESYTYDAHDKLLTAGTKSYGYDLNGNTTSVTVGTSTTTLTYDAENRVKTITYPSSATNTFTYNGQGLRVGKTDSAGTFSYVCDGTNVASPVLKDGAAVYTPGVSERRGTTSKFLHTDALGSTRGITSSTQTATDSQLFDAFGMSVSRTGTTPTPFGFAGKVQYQTDNDSGLLLLGHRYYDPSTGRFLSSDPAHSGSNWYEYCNNNPLGGIDPCGLKTNVTESKDEFVVTTTIQFITHGDKNNPVGPFDIAGIVNSIEDRWNNGGKNFVHNGKPVRFKIDWVVGSDLSDYQRDRIDIYPLYPGRPFTGGVTTKNGEPDFPTFISGPGTWHWGKWGIGNAYHQSLWPHEYGHLIGFGDQYEDKDLYPARYGHEKDIMARPDSPVQQSQIDQWFDHLGY